MLTKADELTKTQQKVYKLLAAGKSYKEIADILDKPLETIKSHIREIKLRVPYQKQGEIIASFWCEMFGASFEEQRKQIIASCLTLLLIATIQMDFTDKYRRIEQRRVARTEVRFTGRKTEYSSAS